MNHFLPGTIHSYVFLTFASVDEALVKYNKGTKVAGSNSDLNGTTHQFVTTQMKALELHVAGVNIYC